MEKQQSKGKERKKERKKGKQDVISGIPLLL
jgi:hypothetical protein